eukprot:GHVU01163181.1.p2 GENE.GHVU01163181.1~~GHVU01163181.1.p2  ORF type:complete len:145 (+),score=17.21 GHVU01163181.1:202-636(+)
MRARNMEEAALRDDSQTPNARAHRMVKAAEFMGLAAQRAEETGEVIKNYLGSGDYRGEVNQVGKPHGRGVLRYPNGSVHHEGEWRSGITHGLGVNRRFDNGTIWYAGQWKDNRRQGLGVFWNGDGNVDYAGWWNKGDQSQTAPP